MDTNEIYECADHRDFLRRYLEQRKSAGGLRALARKAGFKSPSSLTMLISGERRMTVRSAELLAQALALKGRKRALFLAYARVDLARTEREKSLAREEILQLKSIRPEFRLDSKQFAFLGTWYYPVIFVLVHQKEVAQDAATLARRLGRGVTSVAVEQALTDMEELGLIAKDEHGLWRPLNAALTTHEEVRSAAVGKYHRNAIRLAEEALELPLAAREFNGLTISVPPEMIPTVKEKIRRFRSELNELLAHDESAADVYQLNLQFFPLTQNSERSQT